MMTIPAKSLQSFMDSDKPTGNAGTDRGTILLLVLGYAAFGAIWMLGSDWAVELLLRDSALIAIVGTLKGWAFIAITAMLLYWLMRHRLGQANVVLDAPVQLQGPIAQRRQRSLRLPLTLAGVVIVTLTATTITYDIARHRREEATRLQTIADLKTRQIGDWLTERQNDTRYVHTDRSLAEHYRRWRQQGDGASRTHLLDHLEHFRASMGYRRVRLLDLQGDLLWDSAGAARAIDLRLPATAVAGQASPLVPYRDADGSLHLDVVTTLATSGDGLGATVILSADPATYLFPLLQTWPVPSASAEILLFRRDGDQVLYLNTLRYQADAAAKFRAPLATEKLLAAQVLRGEAKQDSLIEGVDYRAVPVLGVVRAVPGTDWFLVAKLDRTEIFAEARRYSRWAALAGLLALLVIVAGALVLRQRQNLAVARREHGRLMEHEIIFNNALVGIVYLKHRRIVSCNRRLEEVFGYGPGELIGESSERFYDSHQTFETISKDAYRVETERRNFSTELVLKHKDGSLFHGALNGSVLDPAQPDEGSIWIYADISERKRTEGALRKSEALFQSVSQSANDAIITGDSSGKIVKWNRGAECIFGYLENEVIGQPLTLLMPQRFREPHVAGMSRVRAGGEPHVMGKTVELFGVRKDGSEFPLELSLAQWQIAESHFFTGVIRDITARKKIEQELEDQKAHLEELVETRTIELSQALEVAKLADQTKDAFLANMSHELRTPLNAVIGMAGLARNMSTEPKQKDYLDKITSSGQHLNSIINDLLDFSKIAAGHLEFETIAFSLSALLQRCNSVMSFRAAEKELELVETIDAAVPDVLVGDPVRIEQIMLNLLSNAVKFTSTGRIEVLVSLHARTETGVGLEIAVKDTGVGMRAEDLGRLFKPFCQADATVSRKFGGTGLGLAISRRLAEMMDGDITVTSIEGCGTTFTVRIWLGLGNAADLRASVQAAEETLPVWYRNARILVADDQPLNREIVEALLAEVGITPRMAENGQEALDILRESGADAFDLVLMDIQMPVMDGHTATRALRRLPGFETLPIIAMTAHTMEHEKALDSDAGMNDHIGKPFDNVSFYRTLAKWIPADKSVAKRTAEGLPAPLQALAEAGNELSSLRGVDVAAALACFCGNEASYRRWLAEFVAKAGAVPDQMRSEIAAGQPDKAAKTAHAFKGRVGMLGMTDLHREISALEPALHDGTRMEELLSALDCSIGRMRYELARVLDAGAAEAANDRQNIERVVWNDSYSVGVAEMDLQHKKLVGIINQLSDCHADQSAKSSEAFHEVLAGMFDYTQVHFKAEEDYLQAIAYPQLAAHELEHAGFVEKMTAFSMTALENMPERVGVHRYLQEWLLSHILKSDMQYRRFVEESTLQAANTTGQRKSILLIDDDPAVLESLYECLRPHYQTRIATSGKDGLELARLYPQPDLVLLDVELPDIKGYAVCTALKQDRLTAAIPVMFLSSHTDAGGITYGLELGGVDYVTKPVAPPILLARVQTHLRLREARDELQNRNVHLENLVGKRTGDLEARTLELQRNQDLTIFALGSIAETRDNETGNHIYRTSAYVEVMARRLAAQSSRHHRVTADEWEMIWKSAPLHDIGKVGIPDHILLKPGKLTAEEFEVMKGHATLGRDAIRSAERRVQSEGSFLRVASEIAYSHHERWDGKGYPQGIAGNEIPLSARLMSLADVYDALISKRIYKRAIPHADAVEIIREGRGSHFDPEILDTFLELTVQFHDIAVRFDDGIGE